MSNFKIWKSQVQVLQVKVGRLCRELIIKFMQCRKQKWVLFNESEKQNALNEIQLLAFLNQKFIKGYKEALYIESLDYLHINKHKLMDYNEYVDGGNFAELITNKQNKTHKFQEQEIWLTLINNTGRITQKIDILQRCQINKYFYIKWGLQIRDLNACTLKHQIQLLIKNDENNIITQKSQYLI